MTCQTTCAPVKSTILYVLHSARLAEFLDLWAASCLRRDSLSCLHNIQSTAVEHVFRNPSKNIDMKNTSPGKLTK